VKFQALIGAGLTSLALTSVGCGHSEARQPTAKREPVLYVSSIDIYFCTKKTCLREATAAQVKEISRRAAASSLMKEMHFISAQALRRAHPDGLAGVGLIPPFPNSLAVVPKSQADAQKVTALFRHGDPRLGVYRVFYNYAFR
jgi:hypothetical protein